MEASEIAAAIGVELVGRLRARREAPARTRCAPPTALDAVLKLFDDDVLDLGAAAGLIAALRARGYPAPTIYTAGVHDGIALRDPGTHAGRASWDSRHRNGSRRSATSSSCNATSGVPGRGPWVEPHDHERRRTDASATASTTR